MAVLETENRRGFLGYRECRSLVCKGPFSSEPPNRSTFLVLVPRQHVLAHRRDSDSVVNAQ